MEKVRERRFTHHTTTDHPDVTACQHYWQAGGHLHRPEEGVGPNGGGSQASDGGAGSRGYHCRCGGV